jgi:hypothetical protein
VRTSFLIFISTVFVATIVFGMVIWRQSVKFQQEAAMAKEKQDAYRDHLRLEQGELQVECQNVNSEE